MKKNRWLKWLLIICIPAVIILALVLYLKNETDQLVYKIEIIPVEIAEVADGKYKGYSEAGPVKAEVSVQVKEGKLENIELIRHERGLGGKAEKIIETIVEENNVDVDAVSGATLSSEVIKNAVRNALSKGVK